ncbi:sensor histidine kinase [Plantactinospora solaniradicis]|uniref:histidine kinase n=1 Tax=Plantactinospora solaniradicis TaxID=1723736 RepID=A0ABW1K9M6_9ACTN
MPSATDLYRRLAPWRGYLLAAALAAAMVALSSPIMAKPGQPRALESWTFAAWWTFTGLIVLGLLVQHRWPVPALVLAGVGAAAHQIVAAANNGTIPFPTLIDLAVPVVLYTVASQSRSRWRSMAALAALAGAEVAVSLGNALVVDDTVRPLVQPQRPRIEATPPESANGIDGMPATKSASGDDAMVAFVQQRIVELALVVLLALALAYALGEAARIRHAHVRTLEERAVDLEREQRHRVALAAAAERARIGRDLHDVIAHSLSVIVAQAQAALAAQHRHPERTTQAVREVITVGRDSLAEMRRLVGAFDPDPDAQDRLGSPIGVAALPTLIERVRAAGVPVRYTHDGVPVDLPAGVDASVYRIVQETLTNTLKHGGAGAHARVHLATDPTYVDLEVSDTGVGPSATPDSGHGNGLRGIAERVGLLGGTITVGPNPDGGFLVRTRLPVPPGTP